MEIFGQFNSSPGRMFLLGEIGEMFRGGLSCYDSHDTATHDICGMKSMVLLEYM